MFYCCRHIPAIVLATCLMLVSLGFSESTSSFTTEDILNIWRDQEGRMNDIYIDFDYEETREAEDGSIERRHENITYLAKDNLYRTRKRNFDPTSVDGVSKDWEFSVNGKTKFSYNRLGFDGQVKSSLPENGDIKQGWVVHYLPFTLRMPRKPGSKGNFGDLIGALQQDGDRIGVCEGTYEGRKAVILTRPGYSRIYLDPKLNFAVLGSEATGQLHFKWINSNFSEVAEGIWMPLQILHTTKEGSTRITRRVKVNKLTVNNNYTEKDFEIKFEPGTRVWDRDLGTYITPSPAELDRIYLDGLVKVAEQRDHIDVYHVNEPANRSATVDTNSATLIHEGISNPHVLGEADTSGSPHSWQRVVTFVCIGLTAVLFAFFWLMKHKAKA
jgi:hypothetical protein